MNSDLERIKQDMVTIEQALGREPEFGRGHVWASVGWGVCGVLLIFMDKLLDMLPFEIPTPLLAILGVSMWLGLPILFARLAGHGISSGSMGERREYGVAALLGILLVGVMVWMSRMAVPATLFPAIMFLMTGSWWLLMACSSPWRRGLLVWAVPFLILGFACPFLPEGTWGLAMAATIVFSGFAGALVLHLQLNSYYASGNCASGNHGTSTH